MLQFRETEMWSRKKAENILKHEEYFTIEVQRMWNVKTKVIPIIIQEKETISKSFRKYLSYLPGKDEIKELQKTAILDIAHMLWKTLM